MARIIYQTDKWGNKEGSHYIEFEVNGRTLQIRVDDKHVHVIGAPFKAVCSRSCNSVYMLPHGSPFDEIYQYHVYVDKLTFGNEEEAMKMALKTNLAKAREENGNGDR